MAPHVFDLVRTGVKAGIGKQSRYRVSNDMPLGLRRRQVRDIHPVTNSGFFPAWIQLEIVITAITIMVPLSWNFRQIL